MRKEHKGDDVILLVDSIAEYKSVISSLNMDHIPYKSFCQVMVVLTYSNWLLSNIDENAE